MLLPMYSPYIQHHAGPIDSSPRVKGQQTRSELEFRFKCIHWRERPLDAGGSVPIPCFTADRRGSQVAVAVQIPLSPPREQSVGCGFESNSDILLVAVSF